MRDLGPLLNPIIVNELALIGAIDTAVQRERRPDFVVLFQSTKSGKQANVEQMNAILRGGGERPAERARFRELLLQAQTAMLERIGSTPTLRAMRLVERLIADQYEAVYDEVDGILQRGIRKCWHRALKHWHVLTAHIDLGLERACMRCLLDRAGGRPALQRSDPSPYTYICAGCHDEVVADFPEGVTFGEAEVIEKALGRPSKLKAESLVLAKLSGIAPDVPPPPIPYKTAFASPFDLALPPPAGPPVLQVVNDATTDEEQRYTDRLFDFESVRENW